MSSGKVDQHLAARLKSLREELGYTQEDVAHDAELTASALSRIERGMNSPGWSTVRAIARALGVPIVELAADVEFLEEEAANG